MPPFSTVTTVVGVERPMLTIGTHVGPRARDPAAARAGGMAMYPMLTSDDSIETGRRVLVTQRVVAAVLGGVPAEQKPDLKAACLADATRRLRPLLDREAWSRCTPAGRDV